MEAPYRPDNLTAAPLEHYGALFAEADKREITARTGAALTDDTFTLTILGESRSVTWPDFADEGWKDKDKILALRFLLDGRKPGGYTDFIPYRQLPWGEVYDRQFHNRCINRLAGTFGTNAAAFRRGCEALGGVKLKSSGDAYEIEFMPGLKLRFILWEGEDEFPASAQILFSDNFPDAFSGEDCVIVCEYVLSRLTAAAFR